MAFNKAKAMQEAEKLVAQRKSADAIKTFLLILDKDPTEVAILNTVGDLYFRENNKAEALKCFHRLADAFVKDGFTVKAIAILKKIVKIDPSTVDPILRMAELYVLQGLSREARDQYIQAIDFYKKKQQTDRALETYQKLVALDPENRNIRGKFAEFAEQAGLKEEAALAYAQIAESALRAGDIAAADAALKKSSQIDPGSKSAQLLQARIATGQKDFGRAISLLEADPALKATPAGSQLLLEAYIATERGDEAAKLVDNAYQDKPSDYSPIGIFANLCLQYEKADLAARTIEKICDQVIQNKLGVQLMDSLRQLWTRNPENTSILESVLSVAERTADELSVGEALGALANISERDGDLPKAEIFLSKLVKREPNNEQTRTRLNSVLEQQGKEILEYTPAALSGVPMEIPEEAVAPPPPEAVDEQARVVKEALENSDLFSRYGLTDKAVAELEKVLVTYPDQADIHRRIFEVCQRNLPARAKQASEALARIHEAKGDVAAAAVLEAPGIVEATPATALPSSAGPVAVPSSTDVELDISDVFAAPVQEQPPATEANPSVEVPLDLSSPIETPPVAPAALEHDFSADLDSFATPSTTSEAPPAEAPISEPAAPSEITASQFNFEEARAEVDFYLGQGFVEEARASVATLEQQFPGDPQLATLRQLVEDKAAPPSMPPAEEPEAAPVAEPAVSVAQEIAEVPLAASPEPAKPVATPVPPPAPEPPPATGGDLLGDLAGDLAAGLEGFAESAATPGQGSAQGKSTEGTSNEVSQLSGLLDELGESGPAAAGQDDPETHYNLGVAFREMGLFDEAIGEFQKVVKGARKDHYPENFLQSCTLLAASFIDKGMPQIAAKWYVRALETPKLDEESTLALLYDLGTAYEQAGDSRNALEKFSEVYSQNIDYRDVAEKIRTLQQKAR